MKKTTRDEVQRVERSDAPAEQASDRKKTYQKPVLAKHEQLHGIGLGS